MERLRQLGWIALVAAVVFFIAVVILGAIVTDSVIGSASAATRGGVSDHNQHPRSIPMADTARLIHPVGTPGEPAFAAGWAVTGAIAGRVPLRFRRLPDDSITIEGAVIATQNQAEGATLFTLPPGFHPPLINLIVINVETANGGALSFGMLEIDADGTVKVWHDYATGITHDSALYISANYTQL